MRTTSAGLFILCLLVLISSCGEREQERERERKPVEQTVRPMRLTAPPATLTDDLPPGGLVRGMRENIERLNELNVRSLTFGQKAVSKDDYVLALNYLIDKIKSGASRDHFIETVVANFDFYEANTGNDQGGVLITSYYHPIIPGSKTKTSRYSQALYSVPPGLINIRLDDFAEVFGTLSPTQRQVIEQAPQIGVLRGRLVLPESGGALTVLPYYTREEIEKGRILEGRGLELAWVDPVDAFFLQIQGSGTVRFQDGEELRLGYASKNGRPFVGIAKFLSGVIPREKMSMQAISNHLRELPEEERMKILNLNPSYVFFRKLEGGPVTSLGAEVVDGRTIATDPGFFPKGALAYMEFPKPVFTDATSINPATWKPTSRFVLDQDTGGAILGAHRVDLYWGSGDEAARHAGVMKQPGRLYYLAPKDEFLKRLLKEPDIIPEQKIP